MQLPNNNSNDRNNLDTTNEFVGVVSPQPQGINIQNNGVIQIPMQEPDFSEFMWMANEDLEDFDQKVIRELDQRYGIDSASGLETEEEDFLHRMLEEEEEKNTVYFPNQEMAADSCVNDLSKRLHKMEVTDELAAQSNLNPFAAEFVPAPVFQEPGMAGPIQVLAHPDTHPMTSQMYATNMSASLQGAGMSSMQANVQNLMWRQSALHMSPRYNAPVAAQMNGQGAVRGVFTANGPLYMPNMPVSVYPMMNGGPFLRPMQNRFHHPEAPDRCIEDEGYEDN